MMKWNIPAKTFLLGEYAAIVGAPAIILTTQPCFEVSLIAESGLHGIHSESPAGRWWMRQNISNVGLRWYDPYMGKGGLGASSAQFVGAFSAVNYLLNKSMSQRHLLEAYLNVAWQGEGVRPSGYDVLAQSLQGCVFIGSNAASYQSTAWPFADLAFVLFHTGQKLATHQHLQTFHLPREMQQLANIVDSARLAFTHVDDALLIRAINEYYQALVQLNLVAQHTMTLVHDLQRQTPVLAVKGCGAMGADVIFILLEARHLQNFLQRMRLLKLDVVATSEDLYIQQ